MIPASLFNPSPSAAILAQAAGGASPQGGPNMIVMVVLMFVMMYFIVIRPQRKRQQDHQKLMDSLAVGDHVVMNGGEHGIVTSMQEKTIKVRVAENVKIEYDRGAVASVSKSKGDGSAETAS